jgi:hypothetical protein
MNRIRFDVEPISGGVHCVTPVVDDVSLVTLVGAYETARGWSPAGSYGGLIPEYLRYGPMDAHFLGCSHVPNQGRAYLLSCECGEVGCWPLTALIEPREETVRWSHLAQPYRPAWDYAGFGPFLFDRAQYDEALRALMAVLPEPWE